MEITPEDDILVSMYFRRKTAFRSVCVTSAALSWQSTHLTGNFHETDALGYTFKSQLAPTLASDPYPNQFAAGICEVAVLTDDDVRLIAMFGDSITHMSYFSDSLLTELYRRFPGKCSVINGGISGNRIQKSHPCPQGFPGEGHQFGIAGKNRFLRDLYDGVSPDVVLILEGVNDCTHSIVFGEPEIPTAQDIYEALAEVIGQAHGQGSKVWVCTIPPFGGFGEFWRPQAEVLRCRYNELIRTPCCATQMTRTGCRPACIWATVYTRTGTAESRWRGSFWKSCSLWMVQAYNIACVSYLEKLLCIPLLR